MLNSLILPYSYHKDRMIQSIIWTPYKMFWIKFKSRNYKRSCKVHFRPFKVTWYSYTVCTVTVTVVYTICTVTHISVPSRLALNSLKLNLNDWIKALRRTNRADYLCEKSSLSTSLNQLDSNCISPQPGLPGPLDRSRWTVLTGPFRFSEEFLLCNFSWICQGKSHLKSY